MPEYLEKAREYQPWEPQSTPPTGWPDWTPGFKWPWETPAGQGFQAPWTTRNPLAPMQTMEPGLDYGPYGDPGQIPPELLELYDWETFDQSYIDESGKTVKVTMYRLIPKATMTPYQQWQVSQTALSGAAGMTEEERRYLELAEEKARRAYEQTLWERAQAGDPGAMSEWQQWQTQFLPWQAEQEYGLQQQQLELQRQQQLANLAAHPINWLQYEALKGQPPVVQPFMLPLMSQQYPELANLQVGQPIPGWGGQAGGQMPGYQPFQPTGQPANGGFVGPGGQMPTGGYPAVSGISAPSAIPPPSAPKKEPWEIAAGQVESYMKAQGYSDAEIEAERVFGEYFGALPAGHYIEKFHVRDPNAPPQPSAHPPGYYPELGGRERTPTTPTPSRERPRAPARELPAPKSIAEIKEAQKKKPAPTAPVGRKEPEFPVSRFAGGASYVPRDMTARLHRGEAVIPANQNPWGQPSPRTDIRERFNRPSLREQRIDGGFVGPGGENPLAPRSQPANGGFVGPGGINPALLPTSQPTGNGGFVGPGGINPALLPISKPTGDGGFVGPGGIAPWHRPTSQPADGGFVGPGGINPALLPSSQPADGGFVGPGGIPPWLRPSSRPVDEGFVGPGGIQPYTPTPTQPTPGTWGPGMPGLLNPSAQLWSRMGPTAQQMYLGYQQAATGIRPEEQAWRLWSMSPPSGRYPGLSYAR